MSRINVTKSLLPDRTLFYEYLDKILDSGWLTNRGDFVRQLEDELSDYLSIRNVVLVNNGTSGLQVAIKALNLQGRIISSPFTFIATASAAKWEGLDVDFADIEPETFTISVPDAEAKLTDTTSAIMPVHVYGNPCDVEAIDAFAKSNQMYAIYDAAHAFGVKYKGASVLRWGDISVLSFHATKVFHTIEGGALVTEDDGLCAELRKIINFGITGPESIERLGINAKMNEIQAAMGLCLLRQMDSVISRRQEIAEIYELFLSGHVDFQKMRDGATQNYGYFPIRLRSESEVRDIQRVLNEKEIYPRRYFYPSLDSLKFLESESYCSTARDTADRILCLPIYPELSNNDCKKVAKIILRELGQLR